MTETVTRKVRFQCPNDHVEGTVTTCAAMITPLATIDPTRNTPEEPRPAITPEDALDGRGECPECGEPYTYEWD